MSEDGAAGGRRKSSGRLAAGAVGAAILAACGSDATGPDASRGSVAITAGPTVVRQGDVVSFEARATGGASGAPLTWSVVPTSGGLIRSDGRFVGYSPGTVRVVARAGTAADTLEVEVEPRGLPVGTFRVVGRGEVTTRFTSDLWIHGDVAYTGTRGSRTTGGGARFGDRLYAWDVSDPAAPLLTDSVAVDAETVNDVKIRVDGTLAALTHEGSADGLNGITLLDLSDPRHPTPITRHTAGLELGVHNVWIDGDHVYAVANGTRPDAGSGLHVIEVRDPAAPREVATFWGGTAGTPGSFLHDVQVRDGLAFLSHWDEGIVVLDIGDGIAGGSPAAPVEVGRVRTDGGNTHNAWYWPETVGPDDGRRGGYVFVGDEYGERQAVHVVDARDLTAPREVAIYDVPGETPHNFWLDEENGVLYVAWYTQGLHAIDVTGELLGELHRQGREIASSRYDGLGSCGDGGTCAWAPQLHRGHVFVSDLNSGLWALRLDF